MTDEFSSEMLDIDYARPGYEVKARLIENSQRKNPPVTLLQVAIHVAKILDPEEDAYLNNTTHVLTYEKSNLQLNAGWQLGGQYWPNQPAILVIETPALCVYDAIQRFELHELQHFLKVDGEFVVDPHESS